jgi:hypothetical protein
MLVLIQAQGNPQKGDLIHLKLICKSLRLESVPPGSNPSDGRLSASRTYLI